MRYDAYNKDIIRDNYNYLHFNAYLELKYVLINNMGF
jgi:hypothetical protein